MDDKSELDGNASLDEGQGYSLAKTISFGSMWFTDVTILSFFGVVLFYFYEVEVGLNVAWVALAFVIFAIWNMINDPFIGYLTEKPRSEKLVMKYGFRTPMIIIGNILMIISFFLVFIPPNGSGGTDQILIFIYMVIIICLLDACYTVYNSHMAASTVNMFRTDDERRKVGAIAITFTMLGLLVINAVILPNFIVYGDRNSFVLAAGLTSIIMVINIFVYSYGVREPKKVKEYYLKGRDKEKGEEVPFLKVIKTAMRGKNFKIFIIAYLCYATAYNLFFASQVYFYKDVLKIDFGYFAFAFLALFVGFFVGLPFWLKVAKKYGASNIYGLGYVLFGIIFFSFLWISSIEELIVAMFIGGFIWGASNAILIWVQADIFDEVTTKLGVHQEATLQGITNFFIRLAYLFIGVIIAAVHILTNYNPDPAATQSALAILGIRIHSGVIPGIILIIGGISFLLIYDLKDEKKLKMKEQLMKLMEGKV